MNPASVRQPAHTSTTWCEDADALLAAVFAKVSFIVVPNQDRGTAVLDRMAAKLTGQDITLVRIRNTPSSPLSVGQVLAQIVGSDSDGPASQDRMRSLVRALQPQGLGARTIIVAVDGAHGLTAAVMSFLKLLPRLGPPGGPQVQVVFAGGPQCYVTLAEDRFRAIRESVRRDFEGCRTARYRRLVRFPMPGSAAAMGAAVMIAVGAAAPYCYLLFPGTWSMIFGSPDPFAASPSSDGRWAVMEEVASAPPYRTNPADARSSLRRRKPQAMVALPGKPARRQTQAEQDQRLMDFLAHRPSPVPLSTATTLSER